MSAPPRPGDMKAGFIGLAFALVFLLIVLTAITLLTNRFMGHHQPAASTQQH